MQIVNELIVDAYGCDGPLNDVKQLETAARKAVESVGARIARVTYHAFQPHGLTLCLILQESHFIVSTWPEHRMAIINVFLCNPSMETRAVWKVFEKTLRPSKSVLHEVSHQIGPLREAA